MSPRPRNHSPLGAEALDRLLLSALRSHPSPILQARNAALIGALTGSRLSVAAVAALPRRFLQDPGADLSHFARHWCTVYLSRRRDQDPALFIRHDRARGANAIPLTVRSIERIVAQCAAHAGIVEPVTPERLRATIGGQDVQA